MICSTFAWTRQPSGRNVHRPAPTWRMNPPRTRSLWLAASASAGSSRSVGRKSCEARAIIVVAAGYSLPSGMREASAMASAAGFAIFSRFGRCMPSSIHWSISWKSSSTRMSERDLLQHAAVRVDEADVAAAGDAEVGVARLPGPFTAQPSTATSKCCGYAASRSSTALRQRLRRRRCRARTRGRRS